MSISNKLFPKAFAENAGSTYRYDIPDTNDTEFTNKATYDKGFPAVTMTDIAAGGIPPFGQDMNGVLCDLTTAIRYLQAGNLARYDASFAVAIGGYLKNAVVSDLNANQYRSLVDNNTAELTDTASWKKIDYLDKSDGGTVSGLTNFTKGLQSGGSDVTALSDFLISKSNNGYQKLPNGLIIQWMQGATDSNGSITFTYPVAFPNSLALFIPTCNDNQGTYATKYTDGVTDAKTQMLVNVWKNWSTKYDNANLDVHAIALGY